MFTRVLYNDQFLDPPLNLAFDAKYTAFLTDTIAQLNGRSSPQVSVVLSCPYCFHSLARFRILAIRMCDRFSMHVVDRAQSVLVCNDLVTFVLSSKRTNFKSIDLLREFNHRFREYGWLGLGVLAGMIGDKKSSDQSSPCQYDKRVILVLV